MGPANVRWPEAVVSPNLRPSCRSAAKNSPKSGFDPKPTLGDLSNMLQHLEAGYTCAVVPYRQRKASLQTERGSIYGHSRV
jgi:hypothetical protein